MSPFALSSLMPALMNGIAVKAKPPQKENVLNLIAQIAKKAPRSVGYALVTMVSAVAELTCDVKKEVKSAAIECMTAIAACTGNKDVEPFLPSVVAAAEAITNTHACVEKLAGCIFVQNVETPALAVMLPVLTRGLKDKAEEVQRTCCLIVDNMCKVVEDPAEVLPIMPKLAPLVKATSEKMADPEARGVAEKALKTLYKASEGAEGAKKVETSDALKLITAALGDKMETNEAFHGMSAYTASLAATAANMKVFDSGAWKSDVGFMLPFNTIIEEVRSKMEVSAKPEEEIE